MNFPFEVREDGNAWRIAVRKLLNVCLDLPLCAPDNDFGSSLYKLLFVAA